MNGKDKIIQISVGHLGVAKNLAPFVKELANEMPYAKINLNSVEGKFNDVLYQDMKNNNILAKNVLFENSFENAFNIEFDFVNMPFSYSTGSGDLDFWIDPLKFEKTKFWNDEKIDSIRKSYFKDDKKILLLGSFHEGDMINTIDSLKMVDDTKEYNCLIIPRKFKSESYLEEMLRGKDIRCGEGSSFVIDSTFGILDDLYSISDKVLLGNSFNNVNYVQNPLEPAFYRKRIISGRNDSRMNSEAYEGLKESGLLKVVNRDSFDFKYKLFNEIMSEESNEQILEYQSKANDFINSMKGASKVYAKICQGMMYDTLDSGKQDALKRKLGMDEILNFFE